MEVLSPYKEAAEVIVESGGKLLELFYQCGICGAACPAEAITMNHCSDIELLAQIEALFS